MTYKQMTSERIHEVLEDVKRQRYTLIFLLKKYDGDRKYIWEGGDSWETPSPETAAVFQQLEAAAKAIDRAEDLLAVLFKKVVIAEALP